MTLKAFDKYDHYIRSVQSPESDVDFLARTYFKHRGKKAVLFREDFCGTFILAAAWIRKSREHKAVGLDLDPEPLEYGFKHVMPTLRDEQIKRIQILQKNVLEVDSPEADITAAMNFSYYLFKERHDLKAYFAHALKSLASDGIFVIDCFGGPLCQEVNEEKKKVGNFDYFWDQESFNPITHEAKFHIHFQRRGEKKRLNVFNYDWRMWTIRELREILIEVGFKTTSVYWEGTSKSGDGNGVFRKSEKGEECQAWVAYIVSEK